MVCPEQHPSQRFYLMKPIVGSRQHDEDFQSAEDHTDHFHNQGSIVGHWPGQPNGQTYRTQGGGKFKHGFFQTAPGSQGEKHCTSEKQEEIAAHEAHRVGAELLVNFGSSLCFHVGGRIHAPLGQQLEP